MKLPSIFRITEEASPGLIQLLESVTLGTNGAHYRHLDTRERILDADQPLHLSMERNDKVLGNITFCRRNHHWYLRYFAFSKFLQGKGKLRSSSDKNQLKTAINAFFEQVLSEQSSYGAVDSLYAYIDPNNEKSLWMSETFGFKTTRIIATQTFSRVRLKKHTKVEKVLDWKLVQDLVERNYAQHSFYFDTQTKKGPFYVIRDADNNIIACAKCTIARWAIDRLPGKYGRLLTRVVPFIPGLRRIIRPKRHTFIVPEAVYVEGHDTQLLEALFKGILALEQEHLLLWWVDNQEPLYIKSKSTISWGVLHRIVGVNNVHMVVKHSTTYTADYSKPSYTCGFDFV